LYILNRKTLLKYKNLERVYQKQHPNLLLKDAKQQNRVTLRQRKFRLTSTIRMNNNKIVLKLNYNNKFKLKIANRHL